MSRQLGATKIELPIYGITVYLDEDRRCGTITSDLHSDDDSEELTAALDTVESLILAQAIAGLDITSPAYLESIETTLEAIDNSEHSR